MFGAETSDCDSPISLINETFTWIDKHLKNTIDFVIWTGDSARHDNDELIPRSDEQVLGTNKLLVDKFVEVFGKEENINDTDPTNDFILPIIPTFGNNDILPHNIFDAGPNPWTKSYLSIWKKFIPEDQRHGFDRGGWFFVEVIPNKLAVFSLNTLYFFDSNSLVDGCAAKSEPGYEQLEWLWIQLQFLRQRGMKAIMTGHVPPARTESKNSWDETCWQKYTLWMHQYRDVVVGSMYGHMNIDHFMLQDSKDVKMSSTRRQSKFAARTASKDAFTTQSAADYLTELRIGWSQLPNPPKTIALQRSKASIGSKRALKPRDRGQRKKKGRKSKTDKFFEEIGGEWGERYSLSLVGPSIVPNYFPTLRVIEYNISGLDPVLAMSNPGEGPECKHTADLCDAGSCDEIEQDPTHRRLADKSKSQKKPNKKKRKKGRKDIPQPPSKSSPPGPAYSPQTLTWLGYTQYYANLTEINNDFIPETVNASGDGRFKVDRWKEGKHHGKHPHDKDPKSHAKEFKFEVEYDTRQDEIYNLSDMTVRNYIGLAARMGRYKPPKEDRMEPEIAVGVNGSGKESVLVDRSNNDGDETNKRGFSTTKEKKHKKKKKHRKHGRRKAINQAWFTFVKRAFVGSIDDEDLHEKFGQPVQASEEE